MINKEIQCGICGKMGANPETEICDSVDCAEKLQELWESAYGPLHVPDPPPPPSDWWQSKEDCRMCGGGGCLSCRPSMFL